jgi:Holliday junction resolvasome RuvABC endonuclease subunit
LILGIDVSTSITGFAIVSNDGKIVLSEACDLRKYKDFFSKCLAIREHILDICDKHCALLNGQGIEHIYVEQPFTFFNSGGSSGKTMAALQRFNGVVSWMVYECFEIEPQYLGATQARKLVGIKVPRGQKAKKVVMEHLLATDPDFKIEYTHRGNPKPQEFDRADAIVIARAGIQDLKNKSLAEE